MKECQVLWLEQCRNDFLIYERFRQSGDNPCQVLHYLQMATEKLAKAYFWRSGKAPSRQTHIGFSRLFRALADNQRAFEALGFKRLDDYQEWCRQTANQLSYQVERLAPALAQDGPNPEYPWPSAKPKESPVSYDFKLWREFKERPAARQFLRYTKKAINDFELYGFR